MWRTQDALGNIEKDGREEGANSRVIGSDVCKRRQGGKARAHFWAGHYGNLRCEGMYCSLEAVGGRVAACIDDLPLTKGKPPGRHRTADRMRD